jgi:hypothetical protein
VLDGCSRFLVHWDLRESMKEADIEMILERAKEKYPEAKPRTVATHAQHLGSPKDISVIMRTERLRLHKLITSKRLTKP